MIESIFRTEGRSTDPNAIAIMNPAQSPINLTRANEIASHKWFWGAGQPVCRITGVSFKQLRSAFGNPIVDKSGNAYSRPRRFFWSLWDDVEELRLVIGSDSNEERKATKWKVGAMSKKEIPQVLGVIEQLFSAECIHPQCSG